MFQNGLILLKNCTGHGGRLEEDGRIHELLATSDYHKKGIGPIVDDELYASFVTKIPAGVECVAVIDPVHPPSSGGKSSVLELPYVCDAGDNEIYYTNGFSPGRPMIAAATGAGVAGHSLGRTTMNIHAIVVWFEYRAASKEVANFRH